MATTHKTHRPAKATKPASGKPAPRKPARSRSAARTASRRLAPKPAAPVVDGSKRSQLIELLNTASGATLSELTRATGWQPHTVRGVISGTLRKKLGLCVECSGDRGARVYRIVEGA